MKNRDTKIKLENTYIVSVYFPKSFVNLQRTRKPPPPKSLDCFHLVVVVTD
jgi:hypothetical protein